jgi:hypothetical protein
MVQRGRATGLFHRNQKYQKIVKSRGKTAGFAAFFPRDPKKIALQDLHNQKLRRRRNKTSFVTPAPSSKQAASEH